MACLQRRERERIVDMTDRSDRQTLVTAARVTREALTHNPIDSGESAIDRAHAWSAYVTSTVASAADLVGRGTEFGWRWFVSGSCGRGEGLPGADVETLLVFDDAADRDTILTAAADVHAVLDEIGLRADSNGAIASRARFARRRADWTSGIVDWTSQPTLDRGVVMTGLLADSVCVVDGTRPLCAEVVARAANSPVLSAMLVDTTAVRATVPSRLRVVTRASETVDIKRAVSDPIVKLARWHALSAGSSAASTPERLAVGGGPLSVEDATALANCWNVVTRLRFGLRRDALRNDFPITDTCELSALAPQDRASLRSVGREVAGIVRALGYVASVQRGGMAT